MVGENTFTISISFTTLIMFRILDTENIYGVFIPFVRIYFTTFDATLIVMEATNPKKSTPPEAPR